MAGFEANLRVMQPRDPSSDPYAPPAVPCEVRCAHCGHFYDSWQIIWRALDGESEAAWCCPTPGCDGVGFGYDIFPTDPEWIDENGNKLFVSDADLGEDPDDEDFVAFLDDDEEDDDPSVDDEDWDDDQDGDWKHASTFFHFDDEDDDGDFIAPTMEDMVNPDMFWVKVGYTKPRVTGNVPQPPFDAMLPDKYWYPSSDELNEDDIPF